MKKQTRNTNLEKDYEAESKYWDKHSGSRKNGDYVTFTFGTDFVDATKNAVADENFITDDPMHVKSISFVKAHPAGWVAYTNKPVNTYKVVYGLKI